MRGEIKKNHWKKIEKKQIAVKKIKIKLKIENKLNYTFIFW
jgi:hypothetical protein